MATLVCGALCGHGAAHAGAFAVQAQSASAAGNANAGVTASTEDASVAWFNPAGMVHFKQTQVVNTLIADISRIEFEDQGSMPAAGQPLGGTGGNAGSVQPLLQLYAVKPLSPKWAAGVTLNVPFGLQTKYDDDWMGRFQATKSQVLNVSLNPAVAYRATDDLWLGAGVSITWFKATLTNAVNYSSVVANGAARLNYTPDQIAALLDPANPNTIAGLSGKAKLQGDDFGFGWNVGAMYQASPALRIGAQYRSRISLHVDGNATFQPPTTANPLAAAIITAVSAPGGALANTPVTADVSLPASASVGAVWTQDRWELLFDALWTQWSSIPGVQFIRPNGSELSSLTYNWRDTWRFAAGANYNLSGQWKIRGGIAWDETVVRDNVYREPRLPDSDRLWLGTGALYKPKDTLWFDFALNVVLPRDASLVNRNNGSTAAFGLLNGTYTSTVVVLYAQATVAF